MPRNTPLAGTGYGKAYKKVMPHKVWQAAMKPERGGALKNYRSTLRGYLCSKEKLFYTTQTEHLAGRFPWLMH